MTHMIQALRRVNNQLPELLSEEFVSGLARQVGWRWRKRVLSPVVMIHLLILQVLHCNTAYSHLPRASKLPFTAAAFCKAKGRFPLVLLAQLIASVWQRCSGAADSTLFHGHRTFYTDGSSASMPDTKALQDRYGMPTSMKAGCGFPVVKLLMLFDAATGLIRQVLINPYRSHELPLELEVRELRYLTGRVGFRSQMVVLVTTLLDPEKYPAMELAELYGRRWRVELNFRHLKTTLKLAVLHGKSPKMVETEILAYVLVYNLVQLVIHEAARRQGVAPDRISFVDAVRWITTADVDDHLPRLIVNPLRPGRFEPRVRKRRHGGFSYMVRPRAELKAMIARGESIGCK